MSSRSLSRMVVSVICIVWVTGNGVALAQTCTPGDPCDIGQWGPILNWPLETIHMILLKNGKVLSVYDRDSATDGFMVFDPDPGAQNPVTAITARPLDLTQAPIRLFCSGHSQLPDGRIVFVGGGLFYGVSHDHTVIFDPDAPLSAPWTVVDDMPEIATGEAGKRWYPTVTGMGDGMILVVAGDEEDSSPHTADTPLIFDALKLPNQQYTELTSADLHLPFFAFDFQLSDGTILYAGSDFAIVEDAQGAPTDEMFSKTLDPIPGALWTDLSAVADPIKGGSAVMYGPDLVIKGGGFDKDCTVGCTQIADVYSLDAMSPTPAWVQRASMAHRRQEAYLIVLPDGKILSVGGSISTVSVLEPELYDPADDTSGWADMALMDATDLVCFGLRATGASCVANDDCKTCTGTNPPQPCQNDVECPTEETCVLKAGHSCKDVPRGHHASAVLLPDARVLIAGGDQTFPPIENRNAQIFSPPYLFAPGGGAATRATIDAIGPVANTMFYGGAATVTLDTPPGAPDANDVTAVSLIRLGAATHSFDHSQRLVDVPVFTAATASELSVEVPVNPNEAPPGFYMLFLVDDNGVPSETAPGVSNIVKLAACPSLAAPTQPPDFEGFDKNRFLSCALSNPGVSAALRVTLSSLPPPFDTHNGETRWVGMPTEVCENSGQEVPPPAGCGSPLTTMWSARLSCDPVFLDWSTYGTIHVSDQAVVPLGVYDIQAVPQGCDASNESSYSPALTVNTSKWGDIVGPFAAGTWMAPDGRVDVTADVVAILDKFSNHPTAPAKAQADIEPETPDLKVTIIDVTSALDAFSGVPYPFPYPPDCP